MPKKRNHAGAQWGDANGTGEHSSAWRQTETYKWVAKNQQRWAKGEHRRKEHGNDEEDDASAAETLESFASEWRSLPDKNSASNSDYYFNSYAHFAIHEDMLKDGARTGSYLKAILGCKHLFEGKTVLDVGSGTGILSLFAAKAGAKQCIGIECSDIIDYAQAIAEKNGYSDRVTFVRGRVEDVVLPVAQVDIIISEWMGYFLIYESMLDSVLFARDKWLVEGGLLFPDHAKLYVAGIEDADYKEEKLGFWSRWMGFDMSFMRSCAIQEPVSDVVSPGSVVTSSTCILDVNLYTARVEDLDFVAEFTLTATRNDFVHAVLVWFDAFFEAHSPPVVLSTAPSVKATHWKQSVLYFEGAFVVSAGEQLVGTLGARKSSANRRDLDLKLCMETRGRVERDGIVQFYRMR